MHKNPKTLNELIPQIRKYVTEKTGGAEVIRALRDTLGPLGLKYKSRNIPYKHQKVLQERAEKAAKDKRESLQEQGITIRPAKRNTSRRRKR
ncbi:hypothetical protein NECID01_1097 [Nematocida sp. AWRm77]|nr:hypothetical protein NECID01_1097 [Nematocida sp. AWRm77]